MSGSGSCILYPSDHDDRHRHRGSRLLVGIILFLVICQSGKASSSLHKAYPKAPRNIPRSGFCFNEFSMRSTSINLNPADNRPSVVPSYLKKSSSCFDTTLLTEISGRNSKEYIKRIEGTRVASSSHQRRSKNGTATFDSQDREATTPKSNATARQRLIWGRALFRFAFLWSISLFHEITTPKIKRSGIAAFGSQNRDSPTPISNLG